MVSPSRGTDALDVTGRTALVTGATSGIGRATAVLLGSRGAHVLVHGRDAGRGEQVVKEIETTGGTAAFVAADLSDPTDVTRLVEEAGHVDILVNNAGRSWFGPTAELDQGTYDLTCLERSTRVPLKRLVATVGEGLR